MSPSWHGILRAVGGSALLRHTPLSRRVAEGMPDTSEPVDYLLDLADSQPEHGLDEEDLPELELLGLSELYSQERDERLA